MNNERSAFDDLPEESKNESQNTGFQQWGAPSQGWGAGFDMQKQEPAQQ